MATFDQEITGRYAAAGADHADLDARRVARAVFVRDTIRTLYNADKKFGFDPADNGSLAELVDAAEEHLEHIANDVSQRSVMAPPTHRRRHRMTKHHSALGGVALALALALTGCGGDDNEPTVQETPSQSPSPTPPTASPTPKTDEEKAAAQLTKYLEARDDFYRAVTIDFKRLNPVATGDEFLKIQEAVVTLKRYDIKVTGEYVHTLAEPRRRSDSMILIIDCEDRTDVVERNKDGKKIKHTDPNGDPLRNPVPIEYTVVRDKGAWKVSNSDVKWDQSC